MYKRLPEGVFFSARAGPGLWDPWEGFKKDATFSLIDQLLHCPAAIFQLNSIQTCKISCQTVLFLCYIIFICLRFENSVVDLIFSHLEV